MKTTAHLDGAPCWIDLSTPDVASSRSFYSSLFGWEGDAGPPETGGYLVFSIAEARIAGAMKSPDGTGPGRWTVFFRSDDPAATTRAVEAGGGRVSQEPTQVLDLGTLAAYEDPHGCPFGIWQPAHHPGFGMMREPGAPAWFELTTRNAAASEAFYARVFGWTTVTHPFGGTTYTEVAAAAGDSPFGGIAPRAAGCPTELPDGWRTYFAAEDADAVAARAAELGGTVPAAPVTLENIGRVATLRDPDGGVFSVIAAAGV